MANCQHLFTALITPYQGLLGQWARRSQSGSLEGVRTGAFSYNLSNVESGGVLDMACRPVLRLNSLRRFDNG